MSSVHVSAIPFSTSTATNSDVARRSANFHPSIWGDHFVQYASDYESLVPSDNIEYQRLKGEVRRMFLDNDVENSSKKLLLVDAIQRLGISYNFEVEIDQTLKHIYSSHCEVGDQSQDKDLYTIALRFRLLRQQGYKVSCDVFNKFMNNQVTFKDSLHEVAKGMLSLYEATHLRVHGEDILDEALVFATKHLKSLVTQVSSPLREQIAHALKQPIRKGLTRLEARNYFLMYEQDASHNETLLKFAKLDFNLLQKMHQGELGDIARWWKELQFSTKLPFVRDRVVECYFWILGVYFEPEYVLARRILTKVIAMTSIIDDIYDVYGTPEELELFTMAVERWNVKAMDQLPEYMKVCYRALLDVYVEIEEHMVGLGKPYRVSYAREAMKDQVRAYFEESKWFHQQYVPTMEEYMPLALQTSGYAMLALTSFIGMGDIANESAFNWLLSDPKVVNASRIIGRLMDDIVSHKFEQQRGHVVSSIECYMKQYGATEEEATREFRKQVTDAWKDINEECLYPTAVPMPLIMRIVNLARVIDVVYKDEDGYTHANTVLREFVTSLLVDPAPV